MFQYMKKVAKLQCKGVPQEPVQRLLLFNIFINEMETGLVLNGWYKIIQFHWNVKWEDL